MPVLLPRTRSASYIVRLDDYRNIRTVQRSTGVFNYVIFLIFTVSHDSPSILSSTVFLHYAIILGRTINPRIPPRTGTLNFPIIRNGTVFAGCAVPLNRSIFLTRAVIPGRAE